jgi:hypothetical protein
LLDGLDAGIVGAQIGKEQDDMKLVEILARELSGWPAGSTHCVQDDDCDIKFADGKHPRLPDDEDSAIWVRDIEVHTDIKFTDICLATDHATAIVTREMWQAERALQIGIDAANAGKTTPLADVKFRYTHNPITNRDRIRAIDVQLSELTLERSERIAELSAEGFALLPVVGVVDMSDWRNWEVGDLIECVSHDDMWSRDFKIGSVIMIEEISEDDPLPIYIGLNVIPSDFKFHSRPKPC